VIACRYTSYTYGITQRSSLQQQNPDTGAADEKTDSNPAITSSLTVYLILHLHRYHISISRALLLMFILFVVYSTTKSLAIPDYMAWNGNGSGLIAETIPDFEQKDSGRPQSE
jgi:hypothetical protein